MDEKKFTEGDDTLDSKDIHKKFLQGDVVVKILTGSRETNDTRECGMVNSKEDYEKKLYTHSYQPLLFIIDIHLRLAYLYGCLNRQFKNTKNEEYRFMWRKIGTNEWREWFKVKAYIDNVYNEVNIIEYLC